MKKQFFKHLFLLFSGIFSAALGFAHNNPVAPANGPAAEFACLAPPPAYFIVTDVTPTSISLEWGPTTPFTYYKLDGYDNTAFTPLPTVYPGAGVGSYTYTGLTPGHNYTFEIRASYCPNGEWSDSLTSNRSTPIIIIDQIVELQNSCTPSTSQQTGSNVEFDICVQKSNNPNAPDANSFIGQLVYEGNVLKFLVAYVGNTIEVRPMYHQGMPPSSNFDFTYTAGTVTGESIDCLYGKTTLFTLDNVSIAGLLFNEANMTITFKETLTSFLYCNSCETARPPGGSKTAEMPSERASLPQEPPSAPAILPNPFSASTVLQYGLTEENAVGISLFDATGRLVREVEKTALKSAGTHQTLVDGSGLPDGVYFLCLQTGQKREVLTLVKRE